MASPTAATRLRLRPVILLTLLMSASASSPEADAPAAGRATPSATPAEIAPGPVQLTPSVDERPEGREPGGKTWLHPDHGSGTRGRVTVAEEGRDLLPATLDPERSPTIPMGARDDLAR